MRITQKIGVFLSLSLIFLASCNVGTKLDPVSFDSGYVNNQILLRPADYLNSFNTDDSITLELKYNSTNLISFPRNFNLKYFEKTKNGWVELEEKPVERYPSSEIVFSPDSSSPLVLVLSAYPSIKDQSKKVHLRIYVFGKMETEEGLVDVAAYTDVYLVP
jgi:hypothetical protein